jgi:phosphoadenosine phosphosulfate reductase
MLSNTLYCRWRGSRFMAHAGSRTPGIDPFHHCKGSLTYDATRENPNRRQSELPAHLHRESPRSAAKPRCSQAFMASLSDQSGNAAALIGSVVGDHAPVAFATSLGAEDMVLTDLIARQSLAVEIFTLDTGRLPGETYALLDRVRSHYGLTVRVYYPDALALEQYVTQNGINAFFGSVPLRQQCCSIRKSEPLARALAGKGAWITGLRRSQGVTRTDIGIHEHDRVHGIPKFNPLADWAESDVWDYIRANKVPYNLLHDRGYPSIGCAPCTRAVEPGEDIRAGRWWWEHPDHKECGLHRQTLDVDIRVVASPVTA